MCSEVSAEHGVEAAAEIADFELAHLDAIQNYVKETGADCDLVITRAVDVQLEKKQNDDLKKRYDAWVAAGVDAVKHVTYHEGEKAELVRRAHMMSCSEMLRILLTMSCEVLRRQRRKGCLHIHSWPPLAI